MNKYNYWLNNIKDDTLKEKLKNLPKEKLVNFDKSLSFGTSGMRGTMELGSFNINELTVCKLAKAVAIYISNNHSNKNVVVCFDTRINSKQYSRLFSRVLEKNGINVLLFKDYAPTPLCVYATVNLNAVMGVMITASHNAKEYNGIKLYDNRGLSINRNMQIEISDIFDNVDEVDAYNEIINYKLKNTKYIGKEIQDSFSDRLKSNKIRNLKITYTPLHGTGYYAVKRLLNNNGFTFITPSSQKKPDGEFPTCPYPNPEFDEAFNESITLAKKRKSDIIIATDPDADRLGVAVFDGSKYTRLSGDEVGYILAYTALNKKDKFVTTTVVTSPLIDKICEFKQAHLFKTLTGFVNIGAKTFECNHEFGIDKFALAYEESCGYIVRNDTYDKDGIFACLKICEIADNLKSQNKTLIDLLNEIYDKIGYVCLLRDNKIFQGNNAGDVMSNKINTIRTQGIKSIAGYDIIKTIDYLNDDTGLEKQNFLEFKGENFSFILRPSGTEPKLKTYLFVFGEKTEADQKAQNILKAIRKILQ